LTDLKGDLATLKIDRLQPSRSPWRWPLLFFVPVILVLGGLYALRVQQALSAPEVETVVASVSRGGSEPDAGTPILTASGYVVARRKAVVSSKIQGRLAELKVEEGSRVRQGEVFARLESTDYEASVKRAQAAVQRAEADLGEARRQLDLSERLAKDKVVSTDTVDANRSKVRMAEAQVAQNEADLNFSEASLDNTQIRAPFTGVVVKKMAEVGESVAPIPPGVNISTASGAIVALADLDTLEVEADVAEANVAKLGANQPAEASVEAFPDRKYKSVLRQIIPTADRTKATVQVKVTILDKDKDLKPEMSAKVTFLEPEKEKKKDESQVKAAAAPTVTVPKDAVATRDGKSVVFEIREGKAKSRAVTVGIERQGQVVIREGLSGGETLVLKPGEAVKDGAAVKVKS
jgi:RND family efflux transporter MFP subunit